MPKNFFLFFFLATYLPPVTCAPGQILLKTGKCGCEGQLKYINGNCDCDSGFIRKGTNCERPATTKAPTPRPPPPAPKCLANQKLVNGACIDAATTKPPSNSFS